MVERWMAAVLLLAAMGCGSGGGGSSGDLNFGSMYATTSGGGASPSGPAAPTAAAITIDGVDVVPPAWFALADEQNLSVAIDAYIRDAQQALSGWLPQPAAPGQFALTVVFHDVSGANFWEQSTRTAWLEWPTGPTPLPVRTRFAPLLAQVLVLDRKRELGTTGTAWTAEELDAATRGRNLAVTLDTFFPQAYEAP